MGDSRRQPSIVERLCETAGQLINGTMQDGDVPVAMLVEASDRIQELEVALRDALCELTACAGQLAARGLKGREGDSVSRAQTRARAALKDISK